MENFILAMNVVLPILLTMGIGYLIKKRGMLDEHSLNKMNSLVFRVFMSSLLFMNLYRLDPKRVFRTENLRFISFPVFMVLGMVFLSCLTFLPFVKENRKKSVLIQGAYRGNFILFGLSIAGSVYGEEGMGLTSLLLSVVIPTFNIIAILLLEYYRGQKVSLQKIFRSTFKNPLMLSCFAALICLTFELRLLSVLEVTLSSLSKVATPLAFIILGASLEWGSLRKNWKYLSVVNIYKLILFPALTLSIAKMLHFEGMELLAYLSATACPTAVASFSMAKEMEADADLAAEIVISTSVFSILTIFVWIVVLKSLSWI